jgi:hypothetical protein
VSKSGIISKPYEGLDGNIESGCKARDLVSFLCSMALATYKRTLNTKNTPKGDFLLIAEPMGFEPMRPYEDLSRYKLGVLDRSTTVPKKTSLEGRPIINLSVNIASFRLKSFYL